MYPRNTNPSQRQPSSNASMPRGGGGYARPSSGARVPTSYADLMEDDEYSAPPPPRGTTGRQPSYTNSASRVPPPSSSSGYGVSGGGRGGGGAGRGSIAGGRMMSRTQEEEVSNLDMSANTISAIRNGGVAYRNNVSLSPGGRVRRGNNDNQQQPTPTTERSSYGSGGNTRRDSYGVQDVDHDFGSYGGGGGRRVSSGSYGESDPYQTLGGIGGGGAEPMDAKAVLDAYQALEEMPVGGASRQQQPPASRGRIMGGRMPTSSSAHSSSEQAPQLPSTTGLRGAIGRGGGGSTHAPSSLRPSSTSRGLGAVGRGGGAGRTPSSGISSSSRGGGGMVRGGAPTPQHTVGMLNNEHRVTAKGRVLQGAVDDMYDMYYGAGGEKDPRGAQSNMPAIGGGGRGGGTVARNSRRYEDEETDERLLAKVTGRGGGSVGGGARTSRAVTMEAVMNPQSWIKGPADTEGRIYDASDRNLLCMDVQGKLAVVGSADHGLKVFDITTMREKRKLYGKTCGHSEWVTTVAFLKDGRILSGGMDSKLCLWHASALRCTDLLGHTGSVSQVTTNEHGIAISAGYDRTLRVWDCGTGGGSEVGTMTGHNQPVTMFDWTGPMLMSGDRRGTVKVWDVETNKCAATHATKHGQIGSLGNLLIPQQNDHLSFVGDQGGVVSIFDFRTSGSNPIFAETLHPGGVVSSLKGMNTVDGNDIGGLIVTCGADRQIHVLEPRMNFSPLHTFKEHKDFIYSMETFGGRFILSGGGNGWLLVHDIVTGKCCYGLGANAAAVRNIFATNSHLVCAGDDGKATVYDF